MNKEKEMLLTATKITPYKSINKKTGLKVLKFMYYVEGSVEALAKYKETMGEAYKLDSVTGKPLFYAYANYGNKATVAFTKGDKPHAFMKDDAANNIMGTMERFKDSPLMLKMLATEASKLLLQEDPAVDSLPEIIEEPETTGDDDALGSI